MEDDLMNDQMNDSHSTRQTNITTTTNDNKTNTVPTTGLKEIKDLQRDSKGTNTDTEQKREEGAGREAEEAEEDNVILRWNVKTLLRDSHCPQSLWLKPELTGSPRQCLGNLGTVVAVDVVEETYQIDQIVVVDLLEGIENEKEEKKKVAEAEMEMKKDEVDDDDDD